MLIGKGDSFPLWNTPWVPILPDFRLRSQEIEPGLRELIVKDIMNKEYLILDLEPTEHLLSEKEINAIKLIPISLQEKEDIIIWLNIKDRT